MTDAVFAYITCSTLEEARRIGRALVEERLAACVNIRAHETIYRWEGAIEQGEEWGLIAKTTDGAYAKLQARVVALHSYEVPCVVALPVSDGHAPYLAWIRETTG